MSNLSHFCKICRHDDQHLIETALLAGHEVESVAKEFNLDLNELKVHVAMHLGSFSKDGEEESIAQKLKIKEAVTLRNTYQEYSLTLRKLGTHINRQIALAESTDGGSLDRYLAKSTIDLYLGAGKEVRDTIKTLADIDQQINGRDSNAVNGIVDLVKAIRGSANGTPKMLEEEAE